MEEKKSLYVCKIDTNSALKCLINSYIVHILCTQLHCTLYENDECVQTHIEKYNVYLKCAR